VSEADEANEAKDLAVSSASMLFAALGAVLAPTAAIPTGVAATGIKQFADTIRNRREATEAFYLAESDGLAKKVEEAFAA